MVQNILIGKQNLLNRNMRLNYLYYLKAFAIITVVVYHMGLGTEPIMQFLIHTQMPIFFLVSGYLTYRTGKYDPLQNTIKRAKQLILPLLFCGIGLALLKDVDYLTLLQTQGKEGYWFLLTLFEVSLFYNLSFPVRNKVSNKWRWIIDVIMVVLLMGIRFVLPESLIEGLELRSLSKFYPMFILGVYLKEYPFIITYIRKWNFMFIPLLIYYFCIQAPHSHLILYYIVQVTHGCIGGLFAWYVFLINENNIALKNIWSYIGQHSLDIYLVHFFLLFPAKQIMVTPYFATNLILAIILSGSVILATLLVCRVLESIPIIGYLFLGKTNLYKSQK